MYTLFSFVMLENFLKNNFLHMEYGGGGKISESMSKHGFILHSCLFDKMAIEFLFQNKSP